jgi:hypothetical protein
LKNKLLDIITKEELENLLLKEELTFRAIAKRYNVSITIVSRAVTFCNLRQERTNKLLEIITKEELTDLLFNRYLVPNAIAKLYKVGIETVTRAIAICNIELDEEIWHSGTSLKQRQLLLTNTKLTDRQHQIIVGSLLGDGSAVKGMKNSAFSLDQTAKRKEYVEYLYKELEPFSNLVIMTSTPDKIQNIVRHGYRVTTTKCPEFTVYRKQFYPNGKKIVPPNIEDLLTELGLAHWFMQDGSTSKHNRVSSLCTQGFTVSDVELLIDVLYKKFDIVSYLVLDNKKRPEIHISGSGYTTFHSIVDPLLQGRTKESHVALAYG